MGWERLNSSKLRSTPRGSAPKTAVSPRLGLVCIGIMGLVDGTESMRVAAKPRPGLKFAGITMAERPRAGRPGTSVVGFGPITPRGAVIELKLTTGRVDAESAEAMAAPGVGRASFIAKLSGNPGKRPVNAAAGALTAESGAAIGARAGAPAEERLVGAAALIDVTLTAERPAAAWRPRETREGMETPVLSRPKLTPP
mmetsp:Transcript_135647/g.253461  ORF Transcript_135647/g.253461 Transcript_135647/m.253461 type:complete len:198 (+) Transcript_135647:1344-1937(+)